MPQFALIVKVTENTNDGAPIENATVMAFTDTTDTDAHGIATMDTIYLTVGAPGFQPYVEQPYQIKDLAGVVPISLKRDYRTPAPPSPVPAPPAYNAYHVPVGNPLTEETAQAVVEATAEEFPDLTAVYSSEQDALDAAEQLLLRMIWHLQLVGFKAARQQNPSGRLSNDKLCVQIDGSWRAYDVMSLGFAGRATTIHMMEVFPASAFGDPGIPD